MTQIPLELRVDNTDGFRDISPPEHARERTVNLRFIEAGDSYEVHAWGKAFPDYGKAYIATLSQTRGQVYAAIDQFLESWQRHVIRLRLENEQGYSVRPFEAVPAETDAEAALLWQDTGRKLASAGQRLFHYLFRTGDSRLDEIADLLCAALRGGEQIITVHSDHLFAPWSMLYTANDPQAQMDRGNAPWEPEGFWGYRHLIEHAISSAPFFRTRISLDGQWPAIGMNVDPRLDSEYAAFPFVGPMQRFFEEYGHVSVRSSKEALAEAMAETGLCEHIEYFGCHGSSGGGGAPHARGPQTTLSPALFLGDDEPIHQADFTNWFSRRPLKPGPVVYLAACEAGRIASFFYSSFGLALLERGANCLIGPQIDLPVGFAKEYTSRFFAKFLRRPGMAIGDITRTLARDFIDRHHTPLGLIFTLHRGLDTHLAWRE